MGEGAGGRARGGWSTGVSIERKTDGRRCVGDPSCCCLLLLLLLLPGTVQARPRFATFATLALPEPCPRPPLALSTRGTPPADTKRGARTAGSDARSSVLPGVPLQTRDLVSRPLPPRCDVVCALCARDRCSFSRVFLRQRRLASVEPDKFASGGAGGQRVLGIVTCHTPRPHSARGSRRTQTRESLKKREQPAAFSPPITQAFAKATDLLPVLPVHAIELHVNRRHRPSLCVSNPQRLRRIMRSFETLEMGF